MLTTPKFILLFHKNASIGLKQLRVRLELIRVRKSNNFLKLNPNKTEFMLIGTKLHCSPWNSTCSQRGNLQLGWVRMIEQINALRGMFLTALPRNAFRVSKSRFSDDAVLNTGYLFQHETASTGRLII